jgi:hypothetical protein
MDLVKTYINELAFSQMSNPNFKRRFDLVKIGYEALQENFFEAALGYFNSSKEESIANDEMERVYLLEKAIALSLLAEKSHELHQLICQMYVNSSAKKSSNYPLLAKLYNESMISPKDMALIMRMLPLKFKTEDSDRIS